MHQHRFVVQRLDAGRAKNPWPFAAVGVVLILGAIVLLKPAPVAAPTANATPVTFAQVKTVLEQRCYMCHGEAVQMKGIRLDNSAAVKANAQGVFQQVAVTRQMPMNNSTNITEEERQMIKRWFESGASVE
ncbi:hypothetical protein [Limnohabitans sp.]|uniref:hypothetical protein n=1 Tax=Limnohabitans sp. TaxID=1907725 RepID=UPI003BAFC70B